MPLPIDILRERLHKVEERLSAACKRAGRSRDDVRLIAVTKTVDADVAVCLPELGVLDLGENRPQELWRKSDAMPKTIHWHLIGHLQRNKIERTLPLVHCIHSVDSGRLLQALGDEAERQQRSVDVLLEVNTSGEANKHGFAADNLRDATSVMLSLRRVRLRGLMTMAALQDPEQCRPSFALLRALRDKLRRELPPEHDLHHLSMGMTNDFEVAVEEGATLVRLGTVLFAGLEKKR